MPGLLAMEQQAIANDPLESKLDRAPVRPPDAQDEQKNLLVNGVRPVPDAYSQSTDQPHSNFTNGNLKDVVPALDRSWRDTPANKPLGKLIDRMAQMCYTDMQELVTKIGDEGGRDDAAPEVNGASGGLVTVEDTNVASVKKKRLLLDFASTWRERFVKALVISDWSRTAGEDVAKIIDLRATLMARVMHVEQAIQAIGDLKRDTVASRMPALNIKGAMQYLSTGTSTYPALDHLKLPPLTARQILDLLDDMGTIASLRICLDEPDLPRHMTEYDIANGRATFKTPGEFAVDLACLDQDPEKSPWYFIDFRFNFSPAPSHISEQVRTHLETAINNATTTTGLQGCYDFCHAFVLDQKLVEIESQAYKLSRERWSHQLVVQRSRRLVTVQYWSRRNSVKPSWVEFGINSRGQTKADSLRAPFLGLRWFKEGELVKDISVDIDWTDINLESFLFKVVRQHSIAVLRQIQTTIERRAVDPEVTKLKLRVPEDDPYGISLSAHLPAAHPACTNNILCSINPYTGSWSVGPHSRSAQDLEALFEREADWSKIAFQLEHFICATMQEGIRFEAQLQHWTSVRDVLPLSSKEHKSFFGTAAVNTFWTPSVSWASSTVLSCSSSLSSQTWHIIELKSSPAGRQITAATPLTLPTSEWNGLLRRVQSKAVEQVQYQQMRTDARNTSISYHTEHFEQRMWLKSNSPEDSIAYFFNFDNLMSKQPAFSSKSWAYEPVRASSGILTKSADGRLLVRHEIRLTTKPDRLRALRRYIDTHKAADIAINHEGGVAVLISIPLGTSFLHAMQSSISSLVRLDHSIAISRRLSMKITSLSIQSFSFSYAGPYSMRLTYSHSGTSPVYLKVEPANTNPHQRIRTSLEQLLNKNRPDTFNVFAHVVVLTLPLLKAVEQLESASAPGRTFALHVRHATWYSVKYHGTTTITFTIRARTRLEGSQRIIRWHIEQERQRPGAGRAIPDALTKALVEFWTKPELDGTIGLRTGVAVGAAGIAAAVEKLHSIVSPFVQPVTPALTAASGEAAAESKTRTTTASSAPQQAGKGDNDKQDVIMLD